VHTIPYNEKIKFKNIYAQLLTAGLVVHLSTLNTLLDKKVKKQHNKKIGLDFGIEMLNITY